MPNTTKQVNVAEECDGKHDSCSTSDSCNDQRKRQYEQEQKLKLKLNKAFAEIVSRIEQFLENKMTASGHLEGSR